MTPIYLAHNTLGWLDSSGLGMPGRPLYTPTLSWLVGWQLGDPGGHHMCLVICRMLAWDVSTVFHPQAGWPWLLHTMKLPCADVAQISVCIIFAIVFLAKKSLVAKPCLRGAGPSLGTGRGRTCACVCNLTDNTRIFPRTCHLSPLSPPPPLNPKWTSFLVWLPLLPPALR